MATPLLTPWGEDLDRTCPLKDYPRPQMRREDWDCLNGPWQYAIVAAPTDPIVGSGQLSRPAEWEGEILVPYSPESALSGVGRQLLPGDTLWYRREVTWPALDPSQRRLLHFGAVDQRCRVFLNGVEVGGHQGGYWPFTFDVTDQVRPGVNLVEVAVQDDSDRGDEAYGKQRLDRGGIWYTAQSGIWQTVWSELVPRLHVVALRIEPRLGTPDSVRVRVVLSSPRTAVDGRVEVLDGGTLVAAAELRDNQAELPIPGARRWTPDDPHLYDLRVLAGEDQVTGYVGLREFGLGTGPAGRVCPTLNGRPVFHNGLLDQGYWSDGLYTPPSDQAMVDELTRLKGLGYNMVRKHIKIEPLRWYYHCDRLGLLVWQDFVSGGGPYHPAVVQVAPFLGLSFRDGPRRHRLLGRARAEGRQIFRRDLVRTIELLRNVTSLSVWVPFNEGWGQFDAARIGAEVRALDPTRLIDHASGWFDQGAGDFHSHHVYFRRFRSGPDRFRSGGRRGTARLGGGGTSGGPDRAPVAAEASGRGPASGGRILALTEFGGYSLPVPGHMTTDRQFGYKVLRTRAGLDRALTKLYRRDVLAQIPRGLAAVVYTQVSDVEDEINGLTTYDRRVLKPDPATIRGLNAEIYRRFASLVTGPG